MRQVTQFRTMRHAWNSQTIFDVLPSWVVSISVHVALFFVFAASLKSCQGTMSLETGTDGDRIVGVYVKQATPAARPQDGEVTPAPTAESTNPSNEVPVTEANELAEPPAALSLPTNTAPVLGGAGLPQSGTPGETEVLTAPPSLLSGATGGQLGSGETSMFGIRDSGERFVYVIDASGSMYGDPIRVAKAELIASLQGLSRAQQFQVIFYNKQPSIMRLRGDDGSGMYVATDYNRAAARNFIYRQQPVAGTEHMPALKLALSMQPDVIYFLTDAKEPRLEPAELAEIRRLNSKGTRIHCIEFGMYRDLGEDNFLRQLARQNGGSFQYRDVTTFRSTR